VIVRFVDIDGIVDHHQCLNFLFMKLYVNNQHLFQYNKTGAPTLKQFAYWKEKLGHKTNC
jgi:hypothetical protein